MSSRNRPPGDIEIRTVTTVPDLHEISRLAPLIWQHAFQSIISEAQIRYMLQQRYSLDALRTALTSGTPQYLLVRVDGEAVGFAAHRAGAEPGEWQLQQLYIHPEWQGLGLGARLAAEIEAHARVLACSTLVLTVNRANHQAQQTYLRWGFTVRQSVVVDIGQGFVMDDHVMAKPLGAASANVQ